VTPGWAPSLGLVACVAALVWSCGTYFARVELPRPPIGVYRRFDVLVMSTMVVVAPMGYLALPRTVVAATFGLVLLMAVQMVLAPPAGGRPTLLAGLVLCGADAMVWKLGHPLPVTLLTDAVLALGVVGVANLWAQGGMHAAHVAWFAVLVGGYDLVATGLTDVTARLFDELRGLPFAPMFVLPTRPVPVGVGLGDLLMLALFPLVVTKAFGRRTGRVAEVGQLVLVTAVVALFWLGVVRSTLPLLTVFGPCDAVFFLVCRRRHARERTTFEWHTGVAPLPVAEAVDPLRPLADALAADIPAGCAPGDWLAVVDGVAVGRGATPGLARRSARENGHPGVPIVRQVSAVPAVPTPV
jgi:hypothetical protein